MVNLQMLVVADIIFMIMMSLNGILKALHGHECEQLKYYKVKLQETQNIFGIILNFKSTGENCIFLPVKWSSNLIYPSNKAF